MEKEKKNVLYGAADEILLEEIKQYKVMRNDLSLFMSCYNTYGGENRFDPVKFKKECRGAIHQSKVIVLFCSLSDSLKRTRTSFSKQIKLNPKKDNCLASIFPLNLCSIFAAIFR